MAYDNVGWQGQTLAIKSTIGGNDEQAFLWPNGHHPGASFAIASVMPSNAAPVYVPRSEQVQTDVEKVESHATSLEIAAAASR